jgi:hypothetical protein
LSLSAFAERQESAFPLISKISRSPYGPELELDRDGQDALLAELDRLGARVRELAGSSETSRQPDDTGVSAEAASRGIQSLKRFLEESRRRGWLVYNVTD